MRYVLLLLILSVGVHLWGQEERPDLAQNGSTLPNSASSTKLSNGDATPGLQSLHSLGGAPPVLSIESPSSQQTRHVVNRAFVWLTLYQFAGAILDVESTEALLSRRYREANPLVGEHPSRIQLYGITVPVSTGVLLWSYKLKKKGPHSHLWMIPPSVVGTGHIAAAMHNLRSQ